MFNIIPSISAITGISPQRYFWRTSIALHIGPRFLIAGCYRNQYAQLMQLQFAQSLGSGTHQIAQRLVRLVFWLHIIEITALCGVTYVSNRENYRKYILSTPLYIFLRISYYNLLMFIQRYMRKSS